MKHPYNDLRQRAFWAPSVAQRHMFDIDQLWIPDFKISKRSKIATFGSCFAQHFGKALVERNLRWLNCEPAPAGTPLEIAAKYNYGVFSARTANIYTTSLLLQWVEWAFKVSEPPEVFWKSETGRFVDPFRPTIEPNGFSSVEELIASRNSAISAFRCCLTRSDVFVFTLGLTECWRDRELCVEYPLCPGTIAGKFDDSRHFFVNQQYNEVYASLTKAIDLIREHRSSGPHFLLTVSPVPLTATNSGNHVLVATMESKSTLRSVAGAVARDKVSVSYFPSYEIINSPAFRGVFFEANLRSVSKHGVNHVMECFFKALGLTGMIGLSDALSKNPKRITTRDDVICEEELLSAFGDET